MITAPIILFVYNRLDHTRRTIEALQANWLADESCLYIYSDAAGKDTEIDAVNDVRQFIRTVNGFAETMIVERKTNWGLAGSIINGVTDVVKRHGRVIVLEDDIVTSPFFLKFMNEALGWYKNHNSVWHINGWTPPLKGATPGRTFLQRYMNCWGWGTWRDRWDHFERSPERLISRFTRNEINQFNLDGATNTWRQVKKNKKGTLNTWAVFWYATIFLHKGLCLTSEVSFAENIGHDGSGVNSVMEKTERKSLAATGEFTFPAKIEEDPKMMAAIKQYYKKNKKNVWQRAVNKIRRVLRVNM